MKRLFFLLPILLCAVLAPSLEAGPKPPTRMPTTPDFLYPQGELKADMFPGETLSDNVTAWLAQAATKTSNEAAQGAWVYHRAFTAISNRLHLEAMEIDVDDQVSRRRVIQQARHWKDRSDEQLAYFQSFAETRSRHGASACAPARTFDDDTLRGFT